MTRDKRAALVRILSRRCYACQVMRMALAKRRKALTFISSVGVVGGLDHPQPVTEAEDGPTLCDVHPGDGGYAIGCAL